MGELKMGKIIHKKWQVLELVPTPQHWAKNMLEMFA